MTRSGSDPYLDSDETFGEEEPDRLAQLAGKLPVLFGVVWALLLHDVLPAVLAWAVSSVDTLDLFAPFTSTALQQELGRLGLFLSVVAAIVTTESVTRLARPFGLAPVLLTVLALSVALFPVLAHRQQVHLGLTPEQFAIVLAYSYLALKVGVGVLIGATVGWVLLARTTVSARARPDR